MGDAALAYAQRVGERPTGDTGADPFELEVESTCLHRAGSVARAARAVKSRTQEFTK
jgi:hypothetical protein